MRRLLFKVAMMLIYASNICANSSFFMNNDESKMILDHLADKKDIKPGKTRNLEVSGIIFYDQENWTVWIDGVQCSAIGQQQTLDISIDEVSEDYVVITTADGDTTKLEMSSACRKNEEKEEKIKTA